MHTPTLSQINTANQSSDLGETAPQIAEGQILATVDLGSNSFRLQMARLEAGQLVTIDYYKEPVRLGAGLDEHSCLTPEAIERSVACLTRFAERLRGVAPHAVRAVATQSLRSAKNPEAFIEPAQKALGYPIEIIAGHEEARLIYAGVSHDLPTDDQPRLVVDIGGGSTELIVGTNHSAHIMESMKIGCVSHTLKFFPDGAPTKRNFEQAVLAAAATFEAAIATHGAQHWRYAVGSSGTIETIAELCVQLNDGIQDTTYPINIERMNQLAKLMCQTTPSKWDFADIKEQRAQVLAGGLAVLMGLFQALRVTEMRPCYSALRQGVMIDLLGQNTEQDTRAQTILRLTQRYNVDTAQAQRVSTLATQLYQHICPQAPTLSVQRLNWAALTHEIGMAVSHDGYHHHGAYLMAHTDLAGFSRFAQSYLAELIHAQVGGLRKHQKNFNQLPDYPAHILCLRLATLLAHARFDIELPQAQLQLKGTHIEWNIEADWLQKHPLSAYLLKEEWRAWRKIGYTTPNH